MTCDNVFLSCVYFIATHFVLEIKLLYVTFQYDFENFDFMSDFGKITAQVYLHVSSMGFDCEYWNIKEISTKMYTPF